MFCIVWVVTQLSARISHSRSFEGAIPDIYKQDPGVRLRMMDGTSFWILLAYMEDRVLDRCFSQPRYSSWKMCSLRWRELRAFLHSSIYCRVCSPLKIDLPSQVFLYKAVSRTTEGSAFSCLTPKTLALQTLICCGK